LGCRATGWMVTDGARVRLYDLVPCCTYLVIDQQPLDHTLYRYRHFRAQGHDQTIEVGIEAIYLHRFIKSVGRKQVNAIVSSAGFKAAIGITFR
jgi:hypothetical protein